VNIFLDKDAFIDAIKIAELLNDYDINVTLVKSYELNDDEDINDIGYKKSWQMIYDGIDISNKELFKLKMKFPKILKRRK